VALLASIAAAVVLPGFSPYAVGPDGGVVLTGIFPGTERPGYVYMPPQYSFFDRYPVVYLLHGMPGSPTEYLDGTRLAEFADDAIASQRLRPFVAVLPAAGPAPRYNGEWAGPWERALVDQIVPFVDANLSTIASPSGRVVAGLSAGGFGAVYAALRNPNVFGAVESWSGYFHPLRDGPFRDLTRAELAANDPQRLLAVTAPTLARNHVRFFLSSGPSHSHWFRPSETWSFARLLRRDGLAVTTLAYPVARGEWQAQLDAGLAWAFGPA